MIRQLDDTCWVTGEDRGEHNHSGPRGGRAWSPGLEAGESAPRP
jgi:hypothetical protein